MPGAPMGGDTFPWRLDGTYLNSHEGQVFLSTHVTRLPSDRRPCPCHVHLPCVEMAALGA
eukprot:13286271-Heterocapsa_arctica.AAC.1